MSGFFLVAGLSVKELSILPRVLQSLASAVYNAGGKEGRKGRKREISNYRDFPFWNSIPNVIVLAGARAYRTLILRRCDRLDRDT